MAASVLRPSLAMLLLQCYLDAQAAPIRYGRACLLRSAAWSVAPLLLKPGSAASGDTLALLKQAKVQLASCSILIEKENWDGVRNVVKTPPLANVKSLIKSYSTELGEDGIELMGPREDFVQALQFLDTFVYNNIFISEQNAPGKKGYGVTTDYATPLGYLRDCEAALDSVIEFIP